MKNLNPLELSEINGGMMRCLACLLFNDNTTDSAEEADVSNALAPSEMFTTKHPNITPSKMRTSVILI